MKKAFSSQALTDSARRFCDALVEANVRHCLFYGSVLGMWREGKMIEGDDDVDLLVDRRDWARAVQVVKELGMSVEIAHHDVFMCASGSNGVNVDMYFYDEEEDAVIDYWNFLGLPLRPIRIPKDMVLPTTVCCGINVPADMNACVRYLYGPLAHIHMRKGHDYRIIIDNQRPRVIYMNFEDWDSIYNTREMPTEPSSFCDWALARMIEGPVADVGCGNGRDSVYLAKHKKVYATDSATIPNPLYAYQKTDCENIPIGVKNIYCRMFLHAINKRKQDRFLDACYKALPRGGVFLAECRSRDDELFGVGKKLSDNEYVNGHYRRFLDADTLRDDLFNAGFTVLEVVEGKFSPMGGMNPTFIRVWAIK